MSNVDAAQPAYDDLDGKLKALQQAGYKLFWVAIGNEDFLYQANRDTVSDPGMIFIGQILTIPAR